MSLYIFFLWLLLLVVLWKPSCVVYSGLCSPLVVGVVVLSVPGL